MLDVRFRPLPKWERKPSLRGLRAQFKTKYAATLDKLEQEIRYLKGTDIRIEAGFTLENIRNNGFPRGGARPSHPGVVLYFESKGRSLCFPCGTYSTMEHNLHAIALTLECLRAVDRYGVTVGDEQYRGFAAIAAPEPQMSVEDAAQFISNFSPRYRADGVALSAECYREAYRDAAKKLHPDVAGGDSRGFLKLQAAKTVLDAHHGKAPA